MRKEDWQEAFRESTTAALELLLSQGPGIDRAMKLAGGSVSAKISLKFSESDGGLDVDVALDYVKEKVKVERKLRLDPGQEELFATAPGPVVDIGEAEPEQRLIGAGVPQLTAGTSEV